MPIMLNTSGKTIFTDISKFDKESKRMTIEKRITISPGEIVKLSKSTYDALLKKPIILKMIDDEEIETGDRALAKGAKASAEISKLDKDAIEKGSKE